jgi:hypothetical protein
MHDLSFVVTTIACVSCLSIGHLSAWVSVVASMIDTGDQSTVQLIDVLVVLHSLVF